MHEVVVFIIIKIPSIFFLLNQPSVHITVQLLQLGEEFDETTVDGRDVRALVIVEEGKIISRQTAKKSGEKSLVTTRQLGKEGHLVYTLTIEGQDVVCVQTFKRIQS